MMGNKFWHSLASKIGVTIAGPVYCSNSDCQRRAHDKFEGRYYCSAHLPKGEENPNWPHGKKKEASVVPDSIPLHEARAAGFFKLAKDSGWGLYRVEDIDGGLGSIWSIEKAADGSQFLVKQTDPMGEVMRLKTASAGVGGVENPWTAAWSTHIEKKAAEDAPKKEKSGAETPCKECGKPMGMAYFLDDLGICTKCVKGKHKDVTNPGWRKKKAGAGDIQGPDNNTQIAQRLVQIRKELEYGNSDDARDWLHALSSETPGALGRKINLVWHAMEKDTENGIDEMITLFRQIGGNEAEWDAALAEEGDDDFVGDVTIKEEGPHGR